MIPVRLASIGRRIARRNGSIALAFALVASAIVAGPAPASSGASERSGAIPNSATPRAAAAAAATARSTAAAGASDRLAATETIAPGYDAIGRSLAMLAAGATPEATASPTPPCTGTCTTVPIPDLGSTPAPSAAEKFRLHVPILEYHRIKPLEGETGFAAGLITPPGVFAAQMDALAAAGWKTITLAELGDDLRFGITPAPRTFVITLDDGYEDNYQNAFPILEAHGFTATFFVIAGRIGQPGFLTSFELRRLAANGYEIGNHSYSHRDLAFLSPTDLDRETRGASAVLANITGQWPKSFSYPKGFGSSVITGSLAACPGLNAAVVQGGSQPQTWANHWRLARIRVGPDTYPSLLVEIASRY